MAHGAGTALHREAERLVEDHHLRVLVEDQRAEELGIVGRLRRAARTLGLRIELQRRHPHRRARLQPVGGLGTLAVHAKLALAHKTLDAGEGKLGKPHAEEAVDPHPGLVGGDGQRLHAARQRRRGGGALLAPGRTGGRRLPLGGGRPGDGGLGGRGFRCRGGAAGGLRPEPVPTCGSGADGEQEPRRPRPRARAPPHPRPGCGPRAWRPRGRRCAASARPRGEAGLARGALAARRAFAAGAAMWRTSLHDPLLSSWDDGAKRGARGRRMLRVLSSPLRGGDALGLSRRDQSDRYRPVPRPPRESHDRPSHPCRCRSARRPACRHRSRRPGPWPRRWPAPNRSRPRPGQEPGR